MIAVAKGAQGTDAFQNNKNLMLQVGRARRQRAGADDRGERRALHARRRRRRRSIPSSCSTSRRVASPRKAATHEIVRGFYADVLERIEVEQVREQVQAALWARMER